MFNPEEIDRILKQGEAELKDTIADRLIRVTYPAFMREFTQLLPPTLDADMFLEIVCGACQAVALIMTSTLRSCSHPRDTAQQEHVFNIGCAMLFEELHSTFQASLDPSKHHMIKRMTKQ